MALERPGLRRGLADLAPPALDAAAVSWIAVGISATTAGILLGVAADKMFYESYGIGGWLDGARCWRRGSLRRCCAPTR